MNKKDKQWVIDEINGRKETNPLEIFDCPECGHKTLGSTPTSPQRDNEGLIYPRILILAGYEASNPPKQCFTCGNIFKRIFKRIEKEKWVKVK